MYEARLKSKVKLFNGLIGASTLKSRDLNGRKK